LLLQLPQAFLQLTYMPLLLWWWLLLLLLHHRWLLRLLQHTGAGVGQLGCGADLLHVLCSNKGVTAGDGSTC
jgi:hypothetical protein